MPDVGRIFRLARLHFSQSLSAKVNFRRSSPIRRKAFPTQLPTENLFESFGFEVTEVMKRKVLAQ